MSNFRFHFLIDGLLTNQIALLLSFVGEKSLVKCLGLTVGNSFSLHHLLLAHPLLIARQSLLTPGTPLCSPACLPTCKITPCGKGKETAAMQAMLMLQFPESYVCLLMIDE